jgi:hypothetical protein
LCVGIWHIQRRVIWPDRYVAWEGIICIRRNSLYYGRVRRVANVHDCDVRGARWHTEFANAISATRIVRGTNDDGADLLARRRLSQPLDWIVF